MGSFILVGLAAFRIPCPVVLAAGGKGTACHNIGRTFASFLQDRDKSIDRESADPSV